MTEGCADYIQGIIIIVIILISLEILNKSYYINIKVSLKFDRAWVEE